MASLQEIPVWEEEIYRIQAHIDTPVGGPDGLTNVQPKQIANRTLWLLSRLAREHTLSGHLIGEEQIAENAHIDENKTVLDVSFAELQQKIDDCLSALESLEELAAETIGKDGLMFETIVRAQLFLWDHGAYSYGWEFFTGAMSMRQFSERPIISTVHEDDTIILEDVTGISIGDTLVVYSGDGSDAEVIEVANILHADFGEYRILAKNTVDPQTGEIIVHAITKDRDGGFIGSMSWSVDEMRIATAVPGSVYISGTVDSLNNAQKGVLVIRKPNSDGRLKVEASINGGDWEELTDYRTESYGDDGYDIIFDIPAGILRFRVSSVGSVPAEVEYMAVIPLLGSLSVDPIRKPVIVTPEANSTLAVYEFAMESSPFYRAYHDNLVKTEFSISQDEGIPVLGTPVWTVTVDIEAHVGEMDGDTYVVHDQDLKDFLDAETGEGSDAVRVFPFGEYFIRCRHTSDVGDVSEWSDPVQFTLVDSARFFGFDGSDETLRIGGFDDTGVGTAGETSGKFRSLNDPGIVRFGFAGVAGAGTFGNGTFIIE